MRVPGCLHFCCGGQNGRGSGLLIYVKSQQATAIERCSLEIVKTRGIESFDRLSKVSLSHQRSWYKIKVDLPRNFTPSRRVFRFAGLVFKTKLAKLIGYLI